MPVPHSQRVTLLRCARLVKTLSSWALVWATLSSCTAARQSRLATLNGGDPSIDPLFYPHYISLSSLPSPPSPSLPFPSPFPPLPHLRALSPRLPREGELSVQHPWMSWSWSSSGVPPLCSTPQHIALKCVRVVCVCVVCVLCACLCVFITMYVLNHTTGPSLPTLW